MTSLRPDEQSTNAEIERAQGRDRNIKMGLKTAATVGTAIAGVPAIAVGSKIASKVLPFLSEYIPADLAMKGINKVSPKLGEFLQKGLSKGLNLKEGLSFIKDNLSQPEQPKEQRNIIEQYSPELHQFVKEQISKGNTPLQAAGMAKLVSNKSKFGKVIKDLEKDHKIDLPTLLEQIYGKESSRQQGLSKFNQKVKKPSMLDEETERFNNEYGDVMNPPGSTPTQPPSEQQAFTQQGQGQQQGGPGNQAMMSVLQKILQARGGAP